MALFNNKKLAIISDRDIDLSKASLNKDLSAVDFDNEQKFFYITIDRLLFTNPLTTVKSVLKAHGFVDNLENILSSLDSLTFAVHARSNEGKNSDAPEVREYLPCVRFELPQKNKVGETLQSFYDEISLYQSATDGKRVTIDRSKKTDKEISLKIKELEKINAEQQSRIRLLTQQLAREQKSLSRASRAMDSQQVLPDNIQICRVTQVDFKRRIVIVKVKKGSIEVPTHLLDKVPEVDSRCLLILDDSFLQPIDLVLLEDREIGDLEHRLAKLLYVEGNRFKARDSMRNEFQIRALNDHEKKTISHLKRGVQVLISMSKGHVVRFVVLEDQNAWQFTSCVGEQLLICGLGRNALIDPNEKNISQQA
jgi:hypothetical protein